MKFYSSLRTIKIFNLLKKNLTKKNRNAIIDVGCGTGVLLKDIISLDHKNTYHGLDLSSNMLANTVLSSKDLVSTKLIKGSAFDMPFDNAKFDAAICSRFIHQYNDDLKKDLISEIKRVVKPDGIIIIEFYSLLPRLIRYPFTFSSETRKDYFKHSTSKNKLKEIIGTNYIVEPLIMPFPSLIVKVLGMRIFRQLSFLLPKIGLSPVIDQYLVCFKNRINPNFVLL